MRTLVALLGLAILMAIFAGVHYRGDETQERGSASAFQLAPGEVHSISLQPSLEGEPIEVTITVDGGTVDVFTMDSTWAARLARGGLRLDAPFPYHAQWSPMHVDDVASFSIRSDGRTWYDILLDNSDNYYDGDAVPNGTVQVDVSTRFVAEEGRSLVLGYLATVPSLLLVTVLIVRKWRRRQEERALRKGPPKATGARRRNRLRP